MKLKGLSEVERLEPTIAGKDEKGRQYTVPVLREQGSWPGSWTGMGSGPRMPDELRRSVLADPPRRDIIPVTGVASADAYEILVDGTIIEDIEQT